MLRRDVTFIHKTFQEHEKDNALKLHQKYEDHDSSPPESKYDKGDDGDEDSDAVYAKNVKFGQ